MSATDASDGAGADPERVRAAVARAWPGDDVQVHETHISWVYVAGDRAFKLKKPVVLDFLDYGTPERRRQMCREELRLNARLAPELYLAVRGVADRGGGLDLVEEDDPAAMDYLVEMRRYQERDTLAAAATDARIVPEQIASVGERLAWFHAGCPPVADSQGSRSVRHELEENLSELGDLTEPDLSLRTEALGRFLRAYLAAHRAVLDDRGRRGLIREGHGDLRAEHVVLVPQLSIVDCVEFDPALRTLDVADDLAFLVMDLCAHGAEAAARDLLGAYRGAGGDCGDDTLVWFFAVHRALIRAKVQLVRARQAPAGPDAAARLVGVAERCAWRARGGSALVFCGVPASGKSHLAEALGAAVGCPVISSDRVRKELAGLAPDQRGCAGLYMPEISHRTYHELGRRAAQTIADGRGVLVDATFRHRDDRRAFAEGWANAGEVTFVQCLAPADVLRERAAARQCEPGHISDADVGVVSRELARFQALDEVSPDAHLLVRTDRDGARAIADLLALLDERLAAGSGAA